MSKENRYHNNNLHNFVIILVQKYFNVLTILLAYWSHKNTTNILCKIEHLLIENTK